MRNTYRCLLAALALACGISFPAAQAAEHEPAPHGDSAAQEWEMLPGESLRSLAKLIYPRDSHMQRRFIAATQQLNREALGEVAADQPFEQATALRIPDLHALSAQARKRVAKVRHKAAAAPQAAAAAPQAAAQPTAPAGGKLDAGQLDTAAKRSQERQARLEELKKRMQALEEQSRSMQQQLGKNAPAPAAAQAPQPAAAEPAAEAPAKPRKRVVAE